MICPTSLSYRQAGRPAGARFRRSGRGRPGRWPTPRCRKLRSRIFSWRLRTRGNPGGDCRLRQHLSQPGGQSGDGKVGGARDRHRGNRWRSHGRIQCFQHGDAGRGVRGGAGDETRQSWHHFEMRQRRSYGGAGFDLAAPPRSCGAALQQLGYVFFFAPNFHPAFKHVRRYAKRWPPRAGGTVFNFLGPLINPGRPAHALVGTFSEGWAITLADTMAKLDAKAGLAVAGMIDADHGIDELTTATVNRVRGFGRLAAVDGHWDGKEFGFPSRRLRISAAVICPPAWPSWRPFSVAAARGVWWTRLSSTSPFRSGLSALSVGSGRN